MTRIEKFLKRINMPEGIKIENTPEFLNHIQYNAVTTIAYEI